MRLNTRVAGQPSSVHHSPLCCSWLSFSKIQRCITCSCDHYSPTPVSLFPDQRETITLSDHFKQSLATLTEEESVSKNTLLPFTI